MKAFDNVLRWLETVSYKLEIYDLDPYFRKIITCLKTKNTFLYKTTPREFEFFHKRCTTWYIELLCQFKKNYIRPKKLYGATLN